MRRLSLPCRRGSEAGRSPDQFFGLERRGQDWTRGGSQAQQAQEVEQPEEERTNHEAHDELGDEGRRLPPAGAEPAATALTAPINDLD